MRRPFWRTCWKPLLIAVTARSIYAQQAMTWAEVKDKFQAANPILQAGQIGLGESRAQEISAFLRPNPVATMTLDQLDPFSTHPAQPLYQALPSVAVAYLHEREHKRDLRRESAQQATAVASSTQDDLVRNLQYALRTAFNQTLQAKAQLTTAHDNLNYYDKVIALNRDRFKAGDISQVDLDRVELQRVQFITDVQTADVNLRTAKIQLQTLLNDHGPLDRIDVSGQFDWAAPTASLDEVRTAALASRPDLRVAVQSIEKARTDHQLAVANGSADPTFLIDAGRNPPLDHYVGAGVSIPLRIFDKNQGEKLRTQLDITRDQRLRDAAEAGVLNDVNSAFASFQATVSLLGPYKDQYLPQAAKVRETVSFAYEHGAASLIEFLDAQQQFRALQLSYLNLIGSYLTAANQLNLAVGHEVIP